MIYRYYFFVCDLLQLECDKSQLTEQMSHAEQSALQMRADNVTLYERIRALQQNGAVPTSSLVMAVENKYARVFDDINNPFTKLAQTVYR